MDQKTKILGIVLSVAMLMIMLPVLLKLLQFDYVWLNFVFAAGAVAALVVRLLDKYDGTNMRIRRLYRMSTVSAICYCLSAAIKLTVEMNLWPSLQLSGYDWLGFLTAGAALQIYAALMIGHVEKRQQQQAREKRKK